MRQSDFQLIIDSLSVGNWLQTVLFYFVLILLLRIIMMQLNLSIPKRLNFFSKRVIS
jgi:hypothetical protein